MSLNFLTLPYSHILIFFMMIKEDKESMTQGKIDLINESGRPMKVKVVGEVSEKWN